MGKFMGAHTKGLTNIQFMLRGKLKRKIHQLIQSNNAQKTDQHEPKDIVQYDLLVFMGQNKYLSAESTTHCESRKQIAHQRSLVYVPISGEFQSRYEMRGELGRAHLGQFLYFTIEDCSKTNFDRYLGLPNVEFELEIKANRNQHFSYQQLWLLRIYSIAFVLVMIILGQNIYGIIKDFRSSTHSFWEEWDQSPSLLMFISISCYFASIVLKLIHLFIYAQNGKGLLVLDIMSIMGDMSSQTITSLVIMLLAYGWTIKHSKAQDMQLFIPIFFVLLIINIVIGCLTYVTKGQATKYYDFAGVQGWVLVFFRLCLYAGFVVGCWLSSSDVKQGAIKGFYKKILLSGSAYLLGFPILMIVVSLCSSEWQQTVMHIGSLLTNFLSMGLMMYQFYSKGEYYRASIRSSTILPDKWE